MNTLPCTTLFILLLAPMAVTAAADALQTTPAGARYRDLQPASGKTAVPGNVATIHFTGWLDDGRSKGREI
ncbi:MAG TPA: hypothetical protein VET88_06625 [Gammaproteobacteria bacterium]|nr:hypothetical protein [Gammaproteobacteria bacterium]